tara:strand:- start:22 stop:1116 length:1095 start_codon:yes stop_codon:yes gene_type:complete
MAAPTFYNAADQELYKNFQFVPQEKYRLGFTAPVQGGGQDASTPSFGIPATNAFTNSDGGYNPYMPNTSLNTTYRPNYEYRQFSEYGANPSTMDIKQMDMNQNYFNKPAPTGVEKFLGQAINYVPYIGTIKRGAEFLGNALQGVMPVNQRAILENELRGAGIYTDNIGRIAIGPDGKYNTPEGIMAGYNANQMTDKTFDKRTGNIGQSLQDKTSLTEQQINDIVNEIAETGKYSGDLTDEDLGVKNLFSNLINVNKAKFNFKNKKDKADKIYEFEKKQKEDEKLAAANARDLKTIQRRAAQGDSMSDIGKDMYTGSGQAFEARKDTYTGGKTIDSPSTPGGKYGSPKKDGGRIGYKHGGLASIL